MHTLLDAAPTSHRPHHATYVDDVHVGFWLSRNVFSLGRKALAKLLGTELPTTDRGLLQLLGRLNFAGQFVTDYKRKVRDLYALTRKTSDGRWTSGHT